MYRRKGFSLVELLVVMAIIGILMMMYMGSLSRAKKKAESIATTSAFHQEAVAKIAGAAASAARSNAPLELSRDACRKAYRRTMNTGKQEALVTEMLYVVRNEAEFRAYWNTLINPKATGTLEYTESGALVAQDELGKRFELSPIGDWMDATNRYGTFPISWEFLSINMADMSAGSTVINVVYSDSHTTAVSYPSQFPACSIVAILSDRFLHP